MKYFDCNIKKIDLLKFMKSNLKDYMLTEEDEEFQEIYNFHTSASYSIKPNKFKANPSDASLHIDREDSLALVLGGTKQEAIELVNKFKRSPINKQIVIDAFYEVYSIANQFKFYDGSTPDKVLKEFEQWLDNTNTIRPTIEMGLKYGLVGRTTTGRSNAKIGQLYLNEYFYMADDLTLLTCHTLEFPMKGLFKLTVSILHDGDNTKRYLTIKENGTLSDVTVDEVFKTQLEARFLDRYQAAIKKWTGAENVELNEDYLILLEMVKI